MSKQKSTDVRSDCWRGRDRDVQEETLGDDNICRVLWSLPG
jgi:hypothetical protein